MTHFTVGIIIPQGVNDVESFIDGQMEPYYEHSDAEPYVCYSLEEAAADLRRDITRLERIIERRDPEYNLDKCHDILKELRGTTAEEKYREYLRFHEKFDDQGRPISTYNPDSKWDWYRIGGRWDGWITGNEQNSDDGFNFDARHETVANNIATTTDALRRQIIPHAIITPDGQWHERGQSAGGPFSSPKTTIGMPKRGKSLPAISDTGLSSSTLTFNDATKGVTP